MAAGLMRENFRWHNTGADSEAELRHQEVGEKEVHSNKVKTCAHKINLVSTEMAARIMRKNRARHGTQDASETECAIVGQLS